MLPTQAMLFKGINSTSTFLAEEQVKYFSVSLSKTYSISLNSTQQMWDKMQLSVLGMERGLTRAVISAF